MLARNVGIRLHLDPGDEAILLTPVWPNASAMLQIAQSLAVDRSGRHRHGPRMHLFAYTSPVEPAGLGREG